MHYANVIAVINRGLWQGLLLLASKLLEIVVWGVVSRVDA